MGAYGSPEFLPNDSNDSCDIITKNMVDCVCCGAKYSKKLKKCPKCGKRYAQPFYRRWWFWVIVVVILGWAVSSNFDSYNPVSVIAEEKVEVKAPKVKSKKKKKEKVTLSEEEYKASCVTLSYRDVARKPNDYLGKKAVFRGQVLQVQENGKKVVLRVGVTKTEYGTWEDAIYVDYQRKDSNESRILEEDIVTLYGEMKGIKDYISVMNMQVSVPHVKAEYIEIH